MTVLSIYTVEHPGNIGPVDVDFHHIIVCRDQSAMLDGSIVPVSKLSYLLDLHPYAHKGNT